MHSPCLSESCYPIGVQVRSPIVALAKPFASGGYRLFHTTATLHQAFATSAARTRLSSCALRLKHSVRNGAPAIHACPFPPPTDSDAILLNC